MDAEVPRLLEFDKVKKILRALAAGEPGRQWIDALQPSDDPAAIAAALEQTTQMRAALEDDFRLPMAAVSDVRGAAQRAAGGAAPLEPAVLWTVAESLDCASRAANALKRLGSAYPALVALGEAVPGCDELVRDIRSAIDASGGVKDDASPLLAGFRRRIRSLRKNIERRLERLVAASAVRAYLQYPKPTICRDRYVLPVNARFKHQFPGLVHGCSDSGATLYMEPMETIDLGNELRQCLDQEDEELRRILLALTRQVGAWSGSIIETIDRLGELDGICAKGRMSQIYRMTPPTVTQGRVLQLSRARHPILLRLTQHDAEDGTGQGGPDFDAVVPIDVNLGDDFSVLVITGPNMGGKTVSLKTVGLACLMARAGMHVAAAQATVPLYDAVFADIGDEQSLEQSLSTFSSHVSRIVRTLARAGENSLVLLDELGAGTDPAEGGALGQAVLEELLGRGASTIVTTHLGKLKAFAASRAGAENAFVEFDSESLRPTYRLTVGAAGSSNALEIAERLGMPSGVLDAARQELDLEDAGPQSPALEQVWEARADAEMRKQRAYGLQSEAETLKREYEETLARIKEEEDKISADLGLRIKDRIEELSRLAGELHEDVRFSHKKVAQRVRRMRDELPEVLKTIESLLRGHRPERPVQAGDEVYVVKVRRWGEVLRVDPRRQKAMVRVGGAEMEVDLDDLVPWGTRIESR